MQNNGQEQNIKFSFHMTVQIRNYIHTFHGSVSRSSPQLCRLGPRAGLDIIFWISKNLLPLLAIQPQLPNLMPSCVLILGILRAFFIRWFISMKCSYFAPNSLWGRGRRCGETSLYYQTASTAQQLVFSEQYCNLLHMVKPRLTSCVNARFWPHADMRTWAPSFWSQGILRILTWGPSGTAARLQGSHDSIWGTKGQSIKA